MFSSRRTTASLTSGADRWLVLAGAGLLVLGLVLRLLTDIGRSTAVVDTLPPMADSRVTLPEPSVAAPQDSAAQADSTSAASLGASAEPRVHAEPAPPRASGAVPVKTTPTSAPKAAATSDAAASSPTITTGDWQVQLGVFGQVANAEKLRARVESLGFSTALAPVPGPEGERHRVRAVGFTSEAAARAAAESVTAAIGVRGVVVRPGR